MNKSAACFVIFASIYVAAICSVLKYFEYEKTHYQDGLIEKLASVPDFSQIENVQERKRAFFDYFGLLAESENRSILAERSVLEAMKERFDKTTTLRGKDRKRLAALSVKYKVTFDEDVDATLNELLQRVDTIPVALAQVQAAVESGWGRSRFARQGNNFFGQWCFKAGCGLVPESRAGSKTHEVAVFDSPRQSLAEYMMNLNTFHLYKGFRLKRAQLRSNGSKSSASVLAQTLIHYSERGQAYIDQIEGMIARNKLEAFGST